MRVLGKETVWLILQELSKKNMTPTEMSEKFDMSIANINNFLAKLEEYQIVRRVKKIKGGRGRPFTEYSLDLGPIFILLPSVGKKIKIDYDAAVVKEIEELAKKHKGELLK